jgi:hypothetical protein
MALVLLCGCGGGSVSTTPVAPVAPGQASSNVSVSRTGSVQALPAVSGISGSVVVPPALGGTGTSSASLTVSTTRPGSIPAPPLPALAYFTFTPNGQMYVPWLPQFNATFPAGAIPAGSHIVWLYYRLNAATTTQSHRQLVRARRDEWLTSSRLLAQTAGSVSGSAAAAPAAAGAAGSAGAAGLSVGTIAAIGAGVVAVAAVAAAVASSSSNNGPCSPATCAPQVTPTSAPVAIGSSVTLQATGAATYAAAVQDCADANGAPAVDSTTIATVSPAAQTPTSGTNAAFSVTGVASGTCSLAITANGAVVSSTIVVGAGAPIQAPPASSFAASPTPSASPTASPSPTPSPSPSPSPSASPTPTPTPTSTPTQAPSTAATASTAVPIATTGVIGTFPIPTVAGINGTSNISYAANPAGNNGQSMFITTGLTNFASLPPIASRTPVVYVTLATSAGGSLQFASLPGLTATFAGTLFTLGTQYAVVYTVNGAALSGVGVQLATATTPSRLGDPGAEIDVPTPFANLVLPAGAVLGIVVGK